MKTIISFTIFLSLPVLPVDYSVPIFWMTKMNTIVRVSLLVVLCFTLIGVSHPAFAQSSAPDDFSKIDAYIAETMRRLPVKGMALAIVQGDKVVYLKGYGIANTRGEAVTPQTPFMLGSVTKTFTALAVQQLIHSGEIYVYGPVQRYLPGFRLSDENGGADVTIRHLLDHTSGISTQEGVQAYLNNPKSTFPEALDQLARYRPKYRPGEHYEYSNWNYDLLREVIAQASGQSYTSYVQQNILEPLGMTRASLNDYHTLPHAATYDLNVFGFPVPYDEPYVPIGVGSGYLSASAEEMTHYMIALLNLGRYQDCALLPARTTGWYDAYWNLQSSDPEGVHIQFSGGHHSTSANMQLIPKDRLGVVVLMNTRLDELLPLAPTANDIAVNIANMVRGDAYTLPDFTGFYTGVALVDGLLLVLIASIAWQAFHLKNWRKQVRTAPPTRRSTAWPGIVLDLLLCAGILMFPQALNVSWSIMLYLRPDFSIPLLGVAVCLGLLGLSKAAVRLIRLRPGAMSAETG